MVIKAKSPDQYLELIPEERKTAFRKLRQTILENLPEGFEETIIYDMIGFVVPKSIFPDGYHTNPKLPLSFCAIASQKNFIALYHMGLYADRSLLDWFTAEYPKYSAYKLDMGKSCIRFKKEEHIPFELIAELMRKVSVEKWINTYVSMRPKK